MTARVFAIVGPSGAGKDTLLAAVHRRMPGLHLVRRVITRAAEAGGENFETVTEAGFAARLASGDFALHWRAHGLCYAIPADIPAPPGAPVLFNGSRAVLPEAARAFPGLRVIHVTASDAVLADRLRRRARENADQIAARLERAHLPLPAGLDVVRIDNSGPLDHAVAAMIRVLSGTRPPHEEISA